MTWFKVDDGFPAHRKVEALQALPPATYTAAITIWTLMGADCGLNLSDGVFSRVRLRKITGLPDKLLDVGLAALVKVGLFDRAGDECVFHDWAAMQPTRAQVEALRAAKSAAGARGGVASGQARASHNTKQVLPKNEAGASTNAKQNPSSNPPADEPHARVRNPDPSRPVPTPSQSAADAPGGSDPPPDGSARKVRQDSPPPAAGTPAARALEAIGRASILAAIIPRPNELAAVLAGGAYPAVDVPREIAAAAAWLTANPANAKKNGAAFLARWLTKAQERAPVQGGGVASGLFQNQSRYSREAPPAAIPPPPVVKRGDLAVDQPAMSRAEMAAFAETYRASKLAGVARG